MKHQGAKGTSEQWSRGLDATAPGELVRSGGIAAHRRGNPRQGGDETATGKKTDEGRDGGSEDGESTERGRASATP